MTSINGIGKCCSLRGCPMSSDWFPYSSLESLVSLSLIVACVRTAAESL